MCLVVLILFLYGIILRSVSGGLYSDMNLSVTGMYCLIENSVAGLHRLSVLGFVIQISLLTKSSPPSPTITYRNGFTEPKQFVLQWNLTTKVLWKATWLSTTTI